MRPDDHVCRRMQPFGAGRGGKCGSIVAKQDGDDRRCVPIRDRWRDLFHASRSSSSMRRARPAGNGRGGGSGDCVWDARSMTPLFTRRKRRSSSDAAVAAIGTMRAIGFPRSVFVHSCPICASRRSSLRRAFASRTPIVRNDAFAARQRERDVGSNEGVDPRRPCLSSRYVSRSQTAKEA